MVVVARRLSWCSKCLGTICDLRRMSAGLFLQPSSLRTPGFAFEVSGAQGGRFSQLGGFFPGPDCVKKHLARRILDLLCRVCVPAVLRSLFTSQEMSEFYEERLREAGVSIEKHVTAERLWGLEEQVKRLNCQSVGLKETGNRGMSRIHQPLSHWPGEEERKRGVHTSILPCFAPVLSRGPRVQ